MSNRDTPEPKESRFTLYLREYRLVAALDSQAKQERRSRNQMIEILLEEALAARGGWPIKGHDARN